uniref:Receptor-type tyrosine-protein phosphatase eta n=2 Tax=Schistocephalus solidus TaxID=70667 RepID=A0A0X3QDP8_SCHSO
MTLHPDCPPYDQTVVVLDQSWAAYRMVRRTVLPHARHYATVYIDASYVTRCDFNQKKGVAIVPEFGNVPAFIAASTPMENTCPQFLTMIAQQRCPLVINLDDLYETKTFPPKQYWSDNAEKTFATCVRACNVYVSDVYNSTRWTARTLEITPSDSIQEWTVEQMQISVWSSKMNPRPDILYEFVTAFLDKMATHALNKRVGPPIIHASSTDGRVGTFICATILLLQQLQARSNCIDIFGTVLSLRKHRSNLVNNPNQLEYLYRFMKYCIAMSTTVVCVMPSLPKAELSESQPSYNKP